MEQLLLPKNSSYYWEIKGIRGKKLKKRVDNRCFMFKIEKNTLRNANKQV